MDGRCGALSLNEDYEKNSSMAENFLQKTEGLRGYWCDGTIMTSSEIKISGDFYAQITKRGVKQTI